METKTKIDDIIYALNDTFPEDNDEGHSFVYESNGWYECIRFNEHVLWDTEDRNAWLHERPDWDEDAGIEDDYDDDILGCIKRRFNDYINQLKGYRFDVKSNNDNDDAGEIVDDIFHELGSRKGIELDNFDTDIQLEIFHACKKIVEKYR
jgi:hypothetical protein